MTVLGFGWYNYAKLQPSSSPSLASSSAALAAAASPAPRVEEYRPLAGDEKQLRSGDDDGITDADDDDDKDKGNGSDSESDVLGFPEFPELLATLPPYAKFGMPGPFTSRRVRRSRSRVRGRIHARAGLCGGFSRARWSCWCGGASPTPSLSRRLSRRRSLSISPFTSFRASSSRCSSWRCRTRASATSSAFSVRRRRLTRNLA